MRKFRIARREKKKIKRRSIYLIRIDNEYSVMKSPLENQENYDNYKNGILYPLIKKATKKSVKEYREKMFSEIYVSDVELREMVNLVFSEEYRDNSYDLLLRAKIDDDNKKNYFAFINAYNLSKTESSSYMNTCCMVIDSIIF